MKCRKIIILIFSYIFILIGNTHAIENKIILKINNKIITSIDISNEIKFLNLLNKDLKNLDRNDVYKISKNSLERQKIKEIELLNHYKELTIKEEYLNSLLDQYSKKLEFSSSNEFEKYIRSNRLDMDAIKMKIVVELLWNQLIVKKFSGNIKIDKESIKKQLLKKDIKNEYLLSEIVFTVKKKTDLNKKFNAIKTDIETNGFKNAALEHSLSDTSKNGGQLGWVKETSLSKKIRNILTKINKRSFTQPIQIPGGFLILMIDDIREIKNNLDFEKEFQSSINEQKNKQLNQFSSIYFNKIKKNIKIDEY